ncbi:MAG: glutamate--tRNA ligase, partial [Coriobacteriaceae bacterium]|nr:glutamate--tRNA ligase [Coriobacteriaceae bacterium]
PMTAFLFSGTKVSYDEKSVEKCLRKPDIDKVLSCCLAVLATADLTWEHAALEEALRSVPEQMDLKPKVVFQAIRVAVCGNMVSPPLFESLELLGREQTITRIKAASELLD